MAFKTQTFVDIKLEVHLRTDYVFEFLPVERVEAGPHLATFVLLRDNSIISNGFNKEIDVLQAPFNAAMKSKKGGYLIGTARCIKTTSKPI